MAITPLPSAPLYCGCNGFIGNSSIQNAFKRTYFQVVLQNLYFAGNSTDDESNKVYKMWPRNVHFNAAFTDAFCNEAKENINENITKLKRRLSTRHHTSEAVVRRCSVKKVFLKIS